MKKIISLSLSIIACVTLIMGFSLAVNAEYEYSEDGIYFYDQYEDLTDIEHENIISLAKEYRTKTGYNVGFVISYDLGGKSAMAYSDDIYDETFGINTNGVIVLINNDDYYDYISTSGDAILIYDDARIERMHENAHSALKDEDYYKGLCRYISSLSDYYDKGTPSSNEGYVVNTDTASLEYVGGEDDGFNPMLIIGGLCGFALAFLIAFSFVKGAYRFKSAPSAEKYLDVSETIFKKKTDTFLREYTTSYRVSSSSGGGGGGSSTHHSSGGGTHGGGGHHR